MIEVRPLASSEVREAVKLWEACGLTRPWNDPAADARRALAGPSSTIIAAFASDRLVGTAMTGWDGHRGWIYYLAVESDFRRWGIARKLIQECEDWLARYEAPKVQLMVRTENGEAARFWEALGYEEETFDGTWLALRSVLLPRQRGPAGTIGNVRSHQSAGAEGDQRGDQVEAHCGNAGRGGDQTDRVGADEAGKVTE